ncbi:MAG TPA: cytochrome ubiquinol oxidase subunit I [Advenella sp.]|nr:cytochrome ubiquinol oxidase subunit I [Advenella sp.]
MWDISSLQLAKLQFFSSLSFFSVFGLCTVVLGWLLVVCKGMTHRQAADGRWMDMYRFWVRIFALSMTVALLGMVFILIQSGALWPNLFVRLGPVSGPLIVLIAAITFVIKLFVTDVMLYRQGSLSSWLHSIFVLLAAFGLSVIAVLLICFQSWLHFPAGLAPDTVPLALVDWRAFILQAQAWHRVAFMIAMACLGVGGLMVSISASEALTKPLNAAEQLGFRIGAWLTAVGLGVLVAGGAVFQTELFRQAAPLPIIGRWAQQAVFGLLLLLALTSLIQWCWYLKRRSDFGKLPRWVLHVLVWAGPASWLALWLTHVLLSLRDGQYFVHGLVTYAEAFSEQGVVLISAVTMVMWLLFAVIAAGFIFLARRAARYGVVPVRKIRRTA